MKQVPPPALFSASYDKCGILKLSLKPEAVPLACRLVVPAPRQLRRLWSSSAANLRWREAPGGHTE